MFSGSESKERLMVDEAGEGEPRRRIAVIEVEKLFGLYDHRIELNLDARVTILHGPNGVGKTMLLRMVDCAFKGHWSALHDFPFRRLGVELTDGTRLSFEKKAPYQVGPPEYHQVYLIKPLRSCLLSKSGDIVEEHSMDTANPTAPDWLKGVTQRTHTYLIPIERLVRRLSLTGLDVAVVEYARELAERVEKLQAQYGRRSQDLDQSYPQRLLRVTDGGEDVATLRARMEMLDRKRADLERIGLLDDIHRQPFDLDALDEIEPTKRAVISLYASDTAAKLAVFDLFADRLRLFLDILNPKLRHKRMRADREKGFLIEPVGYEGQAIAPDALSSGEQHELVLHFNLLFNVDPDTLVLIDEPELSLHVIWQKRFMQDLQKIIEVARIDTLVATHSPYIIGEHRDLMVGLSDELP